MPTQPQPNPDNAIRGEPPNPSISPETNAMILPINPNPQAVVMPRDAQEGAHQAKK